MSPDEAKYCLIDPVTRNVQDIIVDDIKKSEELLDTFMGNNVDKRREYLLKHLNDSAEVE